MDINMVASSYSGILYSNENEHITATHNNMSKPHKWTTELKNMT